MYCFVDWYDPDQIGNGTPMDFGILLEKLRFSKRTLPDFERSPRHKERPSTSLFKARTWNYQLLCAKSKFFIFYFRSRSCLPCGATGCLCCIVRVPHRISEYPIALGRAGPGQKMFWVDSRFFTTENEESCWQNLGQTNTKPKQDCSRVLVPCMQHHLFNLTS